MSETERARLTLAVSARDHAEGSKSAAVTLLEYGDYECPHCGRAYPIVKAIQERLGSRLRFVFRNFPLSQMHPHAQHAAEAAEAAAAQGYFWEMHDALFEHQRALSDRHLQEYASTIGIDRARFRQELSVHTHAPRVREDFLSGVRSGVNGTPTFFINGIRHDDPWEFEPLMAALRSLPPRGRDQEMLGESHANGRSHRFSPTYRQGAITGTDRRADRVSRRPDHDRGRCCVATFGSPACKSHGAHFTVVLTNTGIAGGRVNEFTQPEKLAQRSFDNDLILVAK